MASNVENNSVDNIDNDIFEFITIQKMLTPLSNLEKSYLDNFVVIRNFDIMFSEIWPGLPQYSEYKSTRHNLHEEGCITLEKKNIPATLEDIELKCKKIAKSMEMMNSMLVCNAGITEKIKLVNSLMELNEVWISFCGNSNCGKSTLLNSIIGNMYLPSLMESETSLSVQVHFKETVQQQEHQDSAEKDMLCSDGTTLAVGREEILKKLRDLNMNIRNDDEEMKAETCITNCSVFLAQSFHKFIDGNPKVVFVDIPGCDEFGHKQISEIVDKVHEMTSSFVMVTTLQNYRNATSCELLKKLYSENSGILSQNRLTIVITMLDKILIGDSSEVQYTEIEIISKVRKFLCRKVFGNNEDDFPENSIIVVSSKWALHGKQFVNSPSTELYLKQIQREQNMLKHTNYHEHFELPEDDMAKWFLASSNIEVLENRLKTMASRSLYIHHNQIAGQITAIMEELQSGLEKTISTRDEEIKELREQLASHHKVIKDLIKFYQKIVVRKNQDDPVWLIFKLAYSEDMKEDNNVEKFLLELIPVEITVFIDDCKKKVASSKYTNLVFERDLNQFVEVKKDEILKAITKWDSYKLMSKKYEFECMQVFFTTIDLKNSLKTFLGKKTELETHDKDVPLLVPEIIAPLLNTCIHIPEGERGFFSILWEEMKKMMLALQRMFFGDEEESGGGDKEEQNHVRMESSYKEWTEELDQSVNTVREGMINAIKEFYKNCDSTIIQKCLDQYYEACTKILKKFDASMEADISEFIQQTLVTLQRVEAFEEDRQFMKDCLDVSKKALSDFKTLF